MTRLKQDCGQAYVISVLFLAVLLGMTAAVLDVGSWYRADRALQATVDAAALAGAQALPDDPGQAAALALSYADKNGGGLSGGDISFSSEYVSSDTIQVTGSRPAPGFFAKVLGIDSVTVNGTATARASGVAEAQYVAPIVVNWQHEKLQCSPPPCSGPAHATQIELIDLHQPGAGDAAGAFGLIKLDPSISGNAGADDVASWMADGFDQPMPLGDYNSVPSTEFNNVKFKNALSLRLDTEVLFPIYRTITGPGSNAVYDVIGWVGFVPTSFKAAGSTGTVDGYFTKVVWQGIAAKSGPTYGVRIVSLVG